MLPTLGFYSVYWIVVAGTLCMNLFYPYYISNTLNSIRSGLLGSLLVLGTVGLGVVNSPSEESTRFYIALGLMPVFGAFTAFLSYYRIKALDASGLIAEKHVIINVLDVSCIISRCFFATDVELCTRFAVQRSNIESLYRNSSLGMKIFEAGLKKFPESVYLRARYVIFMVFVTFKGI